MQQDEVKLYLVFLYNLPLQYPPENQCSLSLTVYKSYYVIRYLLGDIWSDFFQQINLMIGLVLLKAESIILFMVKFSYKSTPRYVHTFTFPNVLFEVYKLPIFLSNFALSFSMYT